MTESQAELAALAQLSSDQLESWGARYMRLSMDTMQWGWHFRDKSKGYYDENNDFCIYE